MWRRPIINIEQAPATPYVKEVREYRAPTDESIRLLREMEDLARQNVMGEYVFSDNFLTGVVVQLRRGADNPNSTIVIRFTLNGKKFQVSEPFSELGFVFDKQRAVRALVGAVRDTILAEIMPHMAVALESSSRR